MSTPPILDYDQRPDIVEDFDRLPRMFIPGYDASHAMAATLLKLAIGDTSHILAIGAGGGAELLRLAAASPGWSFVAVDPSQAMLARAAERMAEQRPANALTCVQGVAFDAPRAPFDAAIAFLALHFVPDDGSRLAQLKAIHERLKPGAPFLMINGMADPGTAAFESDLARWRLHAELNGAEAEIMEQAEAMQRTQVRFISPERERELLGEAGFGPPKPFYKGLWIEGWEMTA